MVPSVTRSDRLRPDEPGADGTAGTPSAAATRARVLIGPADFARYGGDGRQRLLEQGYTLDENPHDRPLTQVELGQRVNAVDAAIVGVERWDAEIIAAAPKLRVLARLGVGLDNIDLNAARAAGIAVTNAPGLNANAVAEMTVALMLATMRQMPRMNAAARAGSWVRVVGPELSGKTVGLIGLGNIGSLVAQRLRGFDVDLIAYDPYPNHAQADALGVRLLEMDQVLDAADVLSLHLPSMPSTRHIVSDAFLDKVKPGVFLINCARGALIDERALLQSLTTGRVGGAGLDVFEEEPVARSNPLLALANVVATTHAAADTFEAYERTGRLNADAIVDVLSGRDPENLVSIPMREVGR